MLLRLIRRRGFHGSADSHPPPQLGVSRRLSSSYANGDGLCPRPVEVERYSARASHPDLNARFSVLARAVTAAWRPSLADDQALILERRSQRPERCGFPEHKAPVLSGWLGTAMCFLRYGLLAVTLFAAFAGAAPSPLYLAVYGTGATLGKSETLLPARATHRVRATVTDLHWAAIEGDTAEVKRLIAAGANVHATETMNGGERPLHWAAIGGSGGVRALIAAGASLEARNANGETALRTALRSDDADYLALRALLAAGADPVAREPNNGSTALHEAILLDHERGWNAVFLLRQFGADPNAADTIGARPLHYAALRWNEESWGWALTDASFDPHQREADVNAKDNGGQTPLHWFVTRRAGVQDVRVLQWLLSNGADINAVDNHGSTPLDWAVGLGEVELADTLRSFGGVNRRAPVLSP